MSFFTTYPHWEQSFFLIELLYIIFMWQLFVENFTDECGILTGHFQITG